MRIIPDVLAYLKNEFSDMLKDVRMMEAVSNNLFHETRQVRLEILKSRLDEIIKCIQ